MGDFNADPKRNNRFDNIFKNFIENNDFNFITDSFNHKQISYNKGEYQACIDHCMISKTFNMISTNIFSKILYDPHNLSDHNPLSIMIHLQTTISIHEKIVKNHEPQFYTKLPNLENEEIKEKFNNILFINYYSKSFSIQNINTQYSIDLFYDHISSSISHAFNSCKQTIMINNNSKRNKNWFTNKLKHLKEEMIYLRNNNSSQNKIKIIDLKKQFKKEMKANIRLYEKGEFYKISKVIGENNSEKFFKKVKNITKSKEIKIQMEIEEIADSYSNIFNDNLKVPEEQVEMVNREILSLNIKNFNSIKLSIEEFKSAL
jgi:hypothetical protein